MNCLEPRPLMAPSTAEHRPRDGQPPWEVMFPAEPDSDAAWPEAPHWSPGGRSHRPGAPDGAHSQGAGAGWGELLPEILEEIVWPTKPGGTWPLELFKTRGEKRNFAMAMVLVNKHWSTSLNAGVQNMSVRLDPKLKCTARSPDVVPGPDAADAGVGLDDVLARVTSQYVNLTRLKLMHGCTGGHDWGVLAGLAGLPALRWIDVKGCRVGMDCVSVIASLTMLRSVSFEVRADIPDDCWEVIGSMTHLTSLRFQTWRLCHRGCDRPPAPGDGGSGLLALTDARAECLSSLSALRELYIGCEGHLSDEGLRHLGGLDRLTFLTAAFTNPCAEPAVTADGLAHLTRLSALSHLQVGVPVLSCASLPGLTALSSLPKLAHIDVGDVDDLDDESLAYFAPLTQLRELRLVWFRRLSGVGVTHLAALTRLTYLDFCDAFSDAGVPHLTTLQALESLCLRDCLNFTDEGMSGLAKLPRLTSLELDNLYISAEGVSHLTRLKGLASLRLVGERFGDDYLDWLVKLTGLKRLRFRDTLISESKSVWLRDQLRGCEVLREFPREE